MFAAEVQLVRVTGLGNLLPRVALAGPGHLKMEPLHEEFAILAALPAAREALDMSLSCSDTEGSALVLSGGRGETR